MTIPEDDAGLAVAMGTLERIDRRALAAVLDRHAVALHHALGLLTDDEQVVWLPPADLWRPAGPPMAGLLLVTDERVLCLPSNPVASAPAPSSGR